MARTINVRVDVINNQNISLRGPRHVTKSTEVRFLIASRQWLSETVNLQAPKRPEKKGHKNAAMISLHSSFVCLK